MTSPSVKKNWLHLQQQSQQVLKVEITSMQEWLLTTLSTWSWQEHLSLTLKTQASTQQTLQEIRAHKEALHKELIREYKIYCGVEHALKDIILKAVDNDNLLEIEDKILGYLNQTPRQLITHLRNRGRQLDFTDTKKLLSKQDIKWDANKVPQVYFNWVKKTIRQLEQAGIQSNLNEQRNIALFYLKASGEYDAAAREWEAKPAADKTWANIKIFI